jgi:membrane-bound lytic murein transglycosylase B
MSTIARIRRTLGEAGHSQSSTVDRLKALIAERDELKRQINAVKRLARARGIEADTPADAVRMLCMDRSTPARKAPTKTAKPKRASAKKASAKKGRPHPPMMRGKKGWTRADALEDVLKKSGLSKDQLEPCHSKTRWGWKVKR